ncbi:cytotoxic and regulatory T-cell molecule [Microcaecilia unicolor]|uniref:Cytotoxic and regulatory T-cell molecule n=1 Tax=Microcaecilia unicolor TaxID=1415580 RepID=A0A6P7ZVA7_9AMPH|nr:cytotoxic and regulatory T-cell molecule [Microcaecilia unicolor]
MVLLLVKGECQSYHTENITVEEGEMLALRCLVSWEAEAALQWLTPLGFVVFFNNQKVLKDRRYELIHYSQNELSISLSNVTVQDEGLYTCFHYTHPLQSKKVYVTVLAAPSKPMVEASVRDEEETITLICSTFGSKPPPKMSWLLDNGIEIYGEMEHRLDRDGKKCQTSSALVIGVHHTGAVVTCVVRHESLKLGTLTTDFRFTSFSTTDVVTNVPELGPVTSFSPQNYTAHVPSESEQTVTNQSSTEESLTNSTQAATEESSHTIWSEMTSDVQQLKEYYGTAKPRAHSSRTTTSKDPGTGTSSGLEVATLPVENSAAITIPSARTAQRKSGVLLIILVVFLICILLIIVQLFARKLRKAHLAWKKETDVSDQTVESNRSRSNEDNPCQDRNGQITNHKPVLYVNEVFSDTISRSSKENVDPVTPTAEDETIV